MTSPPSWLAPSTQVRNVPAQFVAAQPPLSWQQIGATTQFLLDTFIGKVAIAFGGISIFGWKPLDFLADWGQQRIRDAADNYAAAMNAQSTANYANTQITILTSGSLASNVAGGVSLSEPFTGASADTCGANFARISDGPGGGSFGPDGSGKGVWKKYGGLWRRHFDRHVTPLATDYQAVFVVMANPVESPQVGVVYGPDAYTYLIARSNTGMTSFVYCRIGYKSLEVGCKNSDVWKAWKTIEMTPASIGDQFAFVVGTTANLREFIIRQNGVTRLAYTDTAGNSLVGSGFRSVGFASQAAERNVYTDQTRPAQLDSWSAADRTASSLPGS